MKKRTKIIILSCMVVLLGVTGYLNIALNNNVTTASTQTVTTANYFTTYREDRQATRDQELLYYDAIIANETSSESMVQQAKDKKMEIIDLMEQELIIEGLIKAQGFADAIITNSNNNINVIVKSSELTANEVAKIVAVVKEKTHKDIDNIKIIPVE